MPDLETTSHGKLIRVAVDAMGGDYAPGEIVKGAVEAAKRGGVEIILTGPPDIIEAELANYEIAPLLIHWVRADEFIRENEHPALALRRKPNASVAVATKLVRDGAADAVVSAGSTGALMASATAFLGLLEGIERPVVAGTFLGFAPETVVVDLGANVDCKPYHLLNFAAVGCVCARKMLNIADPKVGLLSTGAEEGKGNELVREAYPLLQKSGLNFIGNVEGNDVVSGKANVVVCDGLLGNVLVKFCEGLGTTIVHWLKEALKDRLDSSSIEGLATDLFSLTNRADVVGGGPLWGAKGMAVVAHGRSRAPEVSGAIHQAKVAVESNLIEEMKSELARIREIERQT